MLLMVSITPAKAADIVDRTCTIYPLDSSLTDGNKKDTFDLGSAFDVVQAFKKSGYRLKTQKPDSQLKANDLITLADYSCRIQRYQVNKNQVMCTAAIKIFRLDAQRRELIFLGSGATTDASEADDLDGAMKKATLLSLKKAPRCIVDAD